MRMKDKDGKEVSLSWDEAQTALQAGTHTVVNENEEPVEDKEVKDTNNPTTIRTSTAKIPDEGELAGSGANVPNSPAERKEDQKKK